MSRILSYFQFLAIRISCPRFYIFFFQAEDGIRDGHVTGVQTCALPILAGSTLNLYKMSGITVPASVPIISVIRSEERRVGKECRSRRARDQKKKKERMNRPSTTTKT